MARLESQKSVLDYVTGSLTRLQGGSARGDKRKLDEYLDSVRDIERRIQRAEEQNVAIAAAASWSGRARSRTTTRSIAS